jgi:alkylhydroperoxidase/carboxymuconolactone decarboxylase family protein YurZ
MSASCPEGDDRVGASCGERIGGGVPGYQEVLRHLAVNDRRLLAGIGRIDAAVEREAPLDARTTALVRVASLVAIGGPVETFRWTIQDALEAGADEDDVVAVLLAIAPFVGVARLSSIAPTVALALDYDLDAALEAPDG